MCFFPRFTVVTVHRQCGLVKMIAGRTGTVFHAFFLENCIEQHTCEGGDLSWPKRGLLVHTH